MTTYNTYTEVKIANPDSEIHKHLGGGLFATKEHISKFVTCGTWNKCHPKTTA